MKKQKSTITLLLASVLLIVNNLNAQQWSNNGTHIYNTNAGNVGIGISASTPASCKLDVRSTASISGLSSNGIFRIGAPNGQNLVFDRDEVQCRNNGNAANLLMNRFGGKVGIGVGNPDAILHVSNTTEAKTAYFENDWSNTNYPKYGVYCKATATGTDHKIGLYAEAEDNGNDDAIGVKGFAKGSNATSNGGDNYGVYGVADNGLNTNSYGVYGKATGQSGTNAYGVYGTASGGTKNWAGYFLGDGYFRDIVGIGTSSPEARLHVKANGTGERLFQVEKGNATKFMVAENGGATIGYGSTVNPPADGLMIKDTVIVGILNGASGYLMSVNGKVICEELRVLNSNNWPDYVFDSSYELLSLDEVEKHINANKHLPGIPSASEIEKNGMALGEMQKKLMEKVEELTLYVIQLNYQNYMLKKQLNEKSESTRKSIEFLQNQIESLK